MLGGRLKRKKKAPCSRTRTATSPKTGAINGDSVVTVWRSWRVCRSHPEAPRSQVSVFHLVAGGIGKQEAGC